MLTVLYLIFNEGYAATSGPLLRTDLCLEAIRLARALADLMPDEPEVLGLLALLLLSEARRPARVGPGGELVTLAEQDRSLWNRELIAEGHELVRRCLRRNRPGPYQLQAAINAVHTDGDATDWTQVLALYDQLLAQTPTPIVALNRAVAVAEVHGPAAGPRRHRRVGAAGLPPAPRHPRRPAGPPRPLDGGPRRLRRGDRAGGQPHRARVPGGPPRGPRRPAVTLGPSAGPAGAAGREPPSRRAAEPPGRRAVSRRAAGRAQPSSQP